MLAKRYIVRGMVQGVGFRWFVRQKARYLKLEGWVRNLPDGSVEVWAEGNEMALAQLKVFLEQGPEFAQVDSVDAINVTPSRKGMRFEIS